MSVIETAAAATELPWRVRYTWGGLEGLQHPEFTYDRRPTESAAIDSAVFMKDRNCNRPVLYVVCAHIQAPGSDTWRPVE